MSFNRGVMGIKKSCKSNLSLAAKRTHQQRQDKTEDAIRRILLSMINRSHGKKITKASVAKKLNLTREQVSKCYSYLFNGINDGRVDHLKGINALSLFDGMSGAQIALQRANINVRQYYASEIDPFAIQVTQNNYPDTKQLGTIKKIRAIDLPKIDLLVGGSPCQGFSFAGKGLNFDDQRSKLFFEYVRILKETQPKYFLLENVKMKKEHIEVITQLLGVEPIEINSALVSAQNRIRLYWTNIKGIKQPKDLNIKLADILEQGYADMHKSYCIDANYAKGGNLKSYFEKHRRQIVFADNTTPKILCGAMRGRYLVNGKRQDHKIKTAGLTKQYLELRDDDKTNALTTVQKDNYVTYKTEQDVRYRKLSVLECERLQTIPDHYSLGVSDSQRYKMLGNGFTVDIIAHIFKKMRI